MTSTQFYQNDTVQRLSNAESYGIVLRCWHDPEDHAPEDFLDPLMRPLVQGEVGVSFVSEGGKREIVRETELRLIDRSFISGDFCKRSVDDAQSGVVRKAIVRTRIEHVISGEPVDGWYTSSDFQPTIHPEMGSYVVYNDWVGQVVEIYDNNTIETASGSIIKLSEFGTRLSVGEKGTHILPPQSRNLSSIFGYIMAPKPDTVIDIEHIVYAVAWLALNQSLDIHSTEGRTRPQRLWYGSDLSKLTIIESNSDASDFHVGDRVIPKKLDGLPFTQHGKDAPHTLVQIFDVWQTETTLEVLWQDGSYETLSAVQVIPYLNPDEYDCWPGDHVVWKSEGTNRHCVVQSFDAQQRIAAVLFTDNGEVDVTSVLELDPSGNADVDPMASGLGVRRGDTVLIHREGTTNGSPSPLVPRIGELEAWVHEAHLPHVPIGWRKEMADIAADLSNGEPQTGQMIYLPELKGSVSWIGEVTNLSTTGTIEVTHPDNSTVWYPLERLTKLNDVAEIAEEGMFDEGEDLHMAGAEDLLSALQGGGQRFHEAWKQYESASFNQDASMSLDLEDDAMDDEEDAWVSDDSGEEVPDLMPLSSLPWLDRMSTEEDENDSDIPDDNVDNDQMETSSIFHAPAAPITELNDMKTEDHGNDAENDEDEDNDTTPWAQFRMLPSAPLDHAFYSSIPNQPSKAFHSRITREYRILASTLPDSIIVRAYEDRADLLRSVIIGPENTPYEDAPFVIDWMLESDFPQSPPKAHFHSWTNGNGRVNPNLYEEGKVCLSILGTWAGDKSESWNAARSSLNQVFVSIQGLVLVKEPWFCEPAYEKLRGTKDGIVNSRLYNEKAYVLSRAFVHRALESPLGGIEDDIRWMYYDKKRLQKVIANAQQLVVASGDDERSDPDAVEDTDLAVPRLTKGGIIMITRTLSKLHSLLETPVA